ncbi:MAG: hypothetical protein GWN00_24610 [Aliifodinibius sp.]|nr:hypothetical protein [Fodinibius sp.]NIY27871.1 hypothetical protein [Fodinibius sp.]
MQDVSTVSTIPIRMASDHPVYQSDASAAFRLVPYRTHFLFANAMNHAEKEFGKLIGAKSTN